MVSDNRYTYLKIDVFRMAVYTLLVPTGKQSVGVIFGTPGTAYLRYSLAVSPNVYAVFPLSV